MTDEEARLAARQRFKGKGKPWCHCQYDWVDELWTYTVGYVAAGTLAEVICGRGGSWEAAFADAERGRRAKR